MQAVSANTALNYDNKDGMSAKMPYATPGLTRHGSVRDLTGSGSSNLTDNNVTRSANTPSDGALKENVVRIGTHPQGFGIYLFDYKAEFRDSFGQGRQFGVIANEVEHIAPEAVSFGNDGYRRVDYDRLGIVRH